MHKYLKINFSKIPKDQRTDIKKQITSDKEFIEYCKNKKDWSYEEHDALMKVLEPERGYGGYYYDIYDRPISYNGIKTLKKADTVLDLSEVHKNEIEKCQNDFKYFRKYYVKIQTRQGKKRPEMRHYQEALEDALLEMHDVAVSFSRQSGKTITVGSYLLWRGNFHPTAINIGIVANKPRTAREVLGKIKSMFLELPIWMMQCVEVWNKSDIELADTNTRFLTDSPSGDSFRGDTISLLFVDEVAFIPVNLWEEMVDSIIPTMSSLTFKQLIYTSTAKGRNHWSQIVELGRKGLNGMKVIENSWREVPHYDKNNKLMDPDEYRKKVIERHGEKFFLQTEENQFIGSSDTLISGSSLYSIERRVQSAEVIPQTILNEGKMYQPSKEGHNYIMTVDAAKDGIDAFAVHVIDVTKFPFEQVFAARLQVDYLIMPLHLIELAKYYNNPFIIIENNEGAGQSVADQLWQVYEYENLYKDKNTEGRVGFKKYPGFRTTVKSRQLIVNMLKIFIEEGKLLINDQETLNELYTFTKRKNGNKYEAEDGYHDDMVMSLAMTFAPFMEIKVFDDFELFTKQLRIVDSNIKTTEVISILDMGFTNDEEDEVVAEMRRVQERLAEQGEQGGADYGVEFTM